MLFQHRRCCFNTVPKPSVVSTQSLCCFSTALKPCVRPGASCVYGLGPGFNTVALLFQHSPQTLCTASGQLCVRPRASCVRRRASCARRAEDVGPVDTNTMVQAILDQDYRCDAFKMFLRLVTELTVMFREMPGEGALMIGCQQGAHRSAFLAAALLTVLVRPQDIPPLMSSCDFMFLTVYGPRPDRFLFFVRRAAFGQILISLFLVRARRTTGTRLWTTSGRFVGSSSSSRPPDIKTGGREGGRERVCSVSGVAARPLATESRILRPLASNIVRPHGQ